MADYEELRERLLLTAELHSAEVKTGRRESTERAFQAGEIQFLLATPTLEMGIDIGQLQNVLMLGVPPLPSNYAQRAGRAGRGSSHYALIVTYCSEDDNHDIYYFADPKQMINGVISPPTFNPFNEQVIQRHVNAFVLSPYLADRRSPVRFWQNFDVEVARRESEVEQLFGKWFDVHGYLSGKFGTELSHVLGRLRDRSGLSRKYLYDNGFFPDYSFRKDNVAVIDERDREKIEKLESEDHLDLSDYAVTTREPEMAVLKFVPGETAFAAGDIYTILPTGHFSEIVPAALDSFAVRSYAYFVARRQIRFATKSKMLIRYQLTTSFELQDGGVEKQKVLRVFYEPNCRIWLRNHGKRGFKTVDPFCDGTECFEIGYDLPPRRALILEFAADVCADERYTLSLASCLDRTIKDRYGLDEGEIRLITAKPTDNFESTSLYVVLYDADGNGNVPLERVYAEFDSIMAEADRKMRVCTCKDGCYVCMRSYNTHYYAGKVSKEIALMFTGYLLGQNLFIPALPPLSSYTPPPDVIMTVELRGPTVNVRCGQRTYSGQITESQNATIFRLMSQIIRAEFVEGMTTLCIKSPLQYILDAITEGTVNRDRAEFSELQFELLRFKHLKVQKP